MSDERELVVDRVLRAPRASVWRCWTEPELLKQWFCPKPWFVSEPKPSYYYCYPPTSFGVCKANSY